MWPARKLAELLSVYCVTGGNPRYVGAFDPRRPLLENIRDAIMRKGSLLYDEVPFLLREEVRDPRVYQAVLAAVAGGARKLSELSSKTGLDKALSTTPILISRSGFRDAAAASDCTLIDLRREGARGI